jgi:polyhydroxyalkanoate synthesis repressor PhaR
MADPVTIKKYSNRRLYDTEASRYVTMAELADKIRDGTNVRVVDAKSGDDLTQATLTQIIIEGRNLAKLLPVPLLMQLIRLGDDALAEFFGRYVTSALDLYLHAKRGAQAISPFNPFAQLPFTASDTLARMWMASPFGARGQAPGPAPAPEPSPVPPGAADGAMDDLAALRKELDELKAQVAGKGGKDSKD